MHLRKILFFFFTLYAATFHASSPAYADDSNYQDLLVGLKSAGMGGAFTAVADDSFAGYYNPAGLAFIKRSRLSLRVLIYSLEKRDIEGGIQQPEGQGSLHFIDLLVERSSSGWVYKFGPKDESGNHVWATGFSMFAPTNYWYSFRDNIDRTLNGKQRTATHMFSHIDNSFFMGQSIARRWGNFGLGLTLYYYQRSIILDFSEHNTLLRCPQSPPGNCSLESLHASVAHLSALTGHINARLGLMWQPSDVLRLGATASLSSIRLWDITTFLIHATQTKDKGPPVRTVVNDRTLKSQVPIPWEFRLGMAYFPKEDVTIAADMVMYVPREQRLLQTDKPMRYLLYPDVIRRNITINVHLGTEFAVSKDIKFRMGVYSNFSSSPEIPKFSHNAYLPQIHMFGVSVGAGVKYSNQEFNIGLNFGYGRGTTQSVQTDPNWQFARASQRNFWLQAHISGVMEFAGYAATQIAKKAIGSISAPKKSPSSSKASKKKKPTKQLPKKK